MKKRVPDCKYNKFVGCSTLNRKCKSCGWNPEVEAERKRKGIKCRN